VREIEDWIVHGRSLMEDWGMKDKLRPGYRALFYGPPGTGKTMTATLLGKFTGRPVFRIDLSMVVSKYIGETEKNLASLFDKAENRDWILFFDEADAIFGKRTGVRDAHDKYANQEVSYLLQRIESYAGLSILASNFKSNIDLAFVRRFNAMIYFPLPSSGERLALWRSAFPEAAPLNPEVSFEDLARRHELTGAQIMNVVQFVCQRSLASGAAEISMIDVDHGVSRELAKEGR
jgi:SpoVK/Ycf46/Vps4 family AAA+-type ATPase